MAGLDFDGTPSFQVPSKLSGLDQDGIFLIEYISQETCPLPNMYMVVSYRVSYIPVPSFLSGSEGMRTFFWLQGRKRNSVFSLLIAKEMYDVQQLETLCRLHFIGYLKGNGRNIDYRLNYNDVFSQWVKGKVILVFPHEAVSVYPKLRGIRIAETHRYDLPNKEYIKTDSYVRYIKEVPRGFDYITFETPYSISDDYLDRALEEITAPNTVRSTKPFVVTLNPNERIRP